MLFPLNLNGKEWKLFTGVFFIWFISTAPNPWKLLGVMEPRPADLKLLPPPKKWASLSASGSCYNYISEGCNIWDLIREDYWGWISLSAVSVGEAHQLIYILNSLHSLRNWKENWLKAAPELFPARRSCCGCRFLEGEKSLISPIKTIHHSADTPLQSSDRESYFSCGQWRGRSHRSSIIYSR